MKPFVEPSALIDPSASIGEGSRVWHGAHIREHARVGEESVISRGVYIGPYVTLGPRCKIQNYALVYEPASLGAGVFVGPGVVLTNDNYPRAVDCDGRLKSSEDWRPSGVVIGDGASIGANATCVAPVRIGRWSVVGAGAVVVNDVLDFALVAGVPAKQIGWVGKAGVPLIQETAEDFRCPATGRTYYFSNGKMAEH